MSEEKDLNITIIGGGPVGLWAAFTPVYVVWLLILLRVCQSLVDNCRSLSEENLRYSSLSANDRCGIDRKISWLNLSVLKIVSHSFERRSAKLWKEEGIFTIATNEANTCLRLSSLLVGMVLRSPSLVDNEDYADNNLFYNVHSLDQFAGKKVVIAGGGISCWLG